MKIVAFGGGHGLGASLRALRRCADLAAGDGERWQLTAVVTVGDNGGSSGRLRQQRDVLPPGDLRQALVALAGDDPYSTTTAALFQYRFDGDDGLAGHPVGNLVLCGLMEQLGDPVAALDHAAAMIGAAGRVLPMSRRPVAIEADVRGADPDRPDEVVTVRGQHEVAVSTGQVEAVRLVPAAPPACREAVAAVAEADWLVFGPGSWYTSVIPHLLVPELAAAVLASPARRMIILNLTTDQETVGMTVPDHLAALAAAAPGLRADLVLGDRDWVADPKPARHAAEALGAELVLAPVAAPGTGARHDPHALAEALLPLLSAVR
ncbi:MAG: uridine diphosphate-N-acetylglucosamine-binding protein YvcK [Micromonosporaceae bacterium]